jgi:hypothetical protein
MENIHNCVFVVSLDRASGYTGNDRPDKGVSAIVTSNRKEENREKRRNSGYSR